VKNYIEKPVDNGGKLFTDWRRPLRKTTVLSRFGLTVTLTYKTPLPGVPCPECGSSMHITGVKLEDENEIFWPQCDAHMFEKDHGFQRWSKHSWKAPQGRPPGSKNRAEPQVSEPVPEPVKVVKPKVTIEVPKLEKVVHPEVIRAAKYVISGERQIYFTGPAGTGKSTAAAHLLEIMSGFERWNGSKMHLLTVSMSTFVADLAGFLDRLNKGEYFKTELVSALESPGLVVVDEADKGNPNLAGFWNTILANNQITTPGGTFRRHEDNVVLFIGNTTGHAPSKQYGGSVRQDFATLDRFRCFNIGFDENVERAAVQGVDEGLYGIVRNIRKTAETTGLQRIVGLRWLKRCQSTLEIEGKSAKDTVLQVMNDESWSKDEILASGINDTPVAANTGKPKYY
jgi:MoxR-like ATPase